MGCGCNRRTRAAKAGQVIAGYRITLPKLDPNDEFEEPRYVPPMGKPPLFSVAEARTEIRAQGGGTVYVEYRQTAG